MFSLLSQFRYIHSFRPGNEASYCVMIKLQFTCEHLVQLTSAHKHAQSRADMEQEVPLGVLLPHSQYY